MIYIGVDVGKAGGIAIIDGDRASAFPYDDDALIGNLRLISMDGNAVACVEHVHAMPGNGNVSMFSFGKSAGFIEGALQAFGIRYELVHPKKWKKEFSVTADKNSSIDVCRRLFPDVSLFRTERCKKPHDGMAEALLMALYAKRRL